MKKVLLFGATGNLGKEIAREATKQGYKLTVVVRNQAKAEEMSSTTSKHIIADITRKKTLYGICSGFDVVISALGKSISPKDKSRTTFEEVDLVANSCILKDALQAGVSKFVYVSAFHSEKYPKLNYCRVHHAFSEKLKSSGMDYSIIKPPALFSAFVDMIEMARKGQLVNMGTGDKKTNPIYEGDLAKICVDAIREKNATIEAGGKQIYSRKELNELIQQVVDPRQKVRSLPLVLVRFMFPFVKLADRNLYDKMAFFLEVSQNDTIAPQVGETRFEDYLEMKMRLRTGNHSLIGGV